VRAPEDAVMVTEPAVCPVTVLVTVPPDTDILEAARVMGDRQIRHLPILEGEHVLGVVGIREVLRALVERLWRDHDAEARETARELLDRQPSPTR